MILSGHQPCYLPGLQLFNKMMHSDVFMYTPHCQFQRGSWHHRNYIDSGLLTVPVHGKLGVPIDEVKIDFSKNWQKKHLRSIEIAYGNDPFFNDYFPDIKYCIESAETLYKLNSHLMNHITSWLRCDNFDRLTYSTENNAEIRAIKDPVDMIIAMCKHVDADTYLSNKGARAYIGPDEEERMLRAGITHQWQDFTTPNYGQTPEVNNGRLSVIDLLFAKGPEAHDIIYNAGGAL